MTFTSALRALPFALLCAATSVAPALVLAETAADSESARSLLKEGNALRASGDLRGALAKYKAAHALVFAPITGLEVGRTHMLLGELVEAREAFLSVGRIPVVAKESKHTAEARAEATRLAAELEPRIPTLIVVLEKVPPKAKVSVAIDGFELPAEAVGATRRVNPGMHLITLSGTEIVTKEVKLDLKEGEKRQIVLTPTPSAKLPPSVDGAAPVTTRPVAEPSTRLSTPTWIGVGLAGAGLLTGTVTGIITLSNSSSLKSGCVQGQCPPEQHSTLERAKTFGAISTISFVVAGAGVVLATVGLLTRGDPRVGQTTLYVGFGHAGLRGTF